MLITSKLAFIHNDCFLPFLTPSKMTNFRLSRIKGIADDNLKFDENGRSLSKWLENTESKGEIAHYTLFLLFSQCFQKTCTVDT